MTRFICLLLAAAALPAAQYQAGLARRKITPERPIYLSGYGSRNHPSEGVAADLWAKALAIEDRNGGRIVIVSTDLIGLPRAISDAVAARAGKEYGLERSRLLLNSSHTHTGPLIRGNLEIMFELKPEESAEVRAYAERLSNILFEIVGEALRDLAPAELAFGNGRATFAMNRREPLPDGSIRLGVNPKGPTDHDVPVLKVTGQDGQLRGVLYGYACHNTTLAGSFYQITGDYAGYSQEAIEKAHPGATALFLALCGGDQNPEPREKLEYSLQHGASLGVEVNRVLGGTLAPVRGPLRTSFLTTRLDFANHTREKFEALASDKNVHKARNARIQLKLYDERRPLQQYSYPVQAVAFGGSLTLVALGGEVVVDYALRIKKEYGGKGIVVAGYSNDVMAYLPSLRVLKEGGYEPVDSMIYYGMPGPWRDDVEDRVMETVHRTLQQVKRSPRK